MLSSSSESSSSDAYSIGSSSSSGSGSSRGWSLISETPLSNRIMVAVEASMDGAEVGSSRCPHGLGFTTLRVESLRVRRLAKPSLHSGGHFWGLPDIYLSLFPLRWLPHISETFKLPSSYKLRAPKDTETVSQSPYYDHLFHPILPSLNFRPTLGPS